MKEITKQLFFKTVGKERAKSFFQQNLLDDVERRLLDFRHTGYLEQIGWINCFQTKKHLDISNKYIPELSYSMIALLEERLNKEMIMFEFGCGFSTNYYAEKVKKVYTVEHNQEWYDLIKKETHDNVQITLKGDETNGEYENSIFNIKEDFDLIIVDGVRRVECFNSAVQSMAGKTVIIVDDTEREAYREIYNVSKQYQLKHIDFWGIGPGSFYNRCSTIFYKEGNAFNL